MDKKNNNGLLKFMKSKEVRNNIWTALVGMVITIVGSIFIGPNKISAVISFIGAIIVFASTEQIMKKISQKK